MLINIKPKLKINIMEDQIKINWYTVLINGIIMILLALLVFYSPGGALLAYALYLGIGFALAGVIFIFQGISMRKGNTNWGWIVFEGFLDLFLGYILLTNPVVTAAIIPFVVGFWAAFYGIYLIIDSFSGTGSMILKLLSGILVLVLGNVIMFNPIAGGLTIAIWFAVLLMIVGIYNVIISFSIKNM
jgi:uncharacterized membrane protein HdeD (DUF308 family)